MTLVWPSREHLPSYVDALERGWSPDNIRGKVAADEELKRIAADADAFLVGMVDREAAGGALNAFTNERRGALWQVERAVRPAGELFDQADAVGDRERGAPAGAEPSRREDAFRRAPDGAVPGQDPPRPSVSISVAACE